MRRDAPQGSSMSPRPEAAPDRSFEREDGWKPRAASIGAALEDLAGQQAQPLARPSNGRRSLRIPKSCSFSRSPAVSARYRRPPRANAGVHALVRRGGGCAGQPRGSRRSRSSTALKLLLRHRRQQPSPAASAEAIGVVSVADRKGDLARRSTSSCCSAEEPRRRARRLARAQVRAGTVITGVSSLALLECWCDDGASRRGFRSSWAWRFRLDQGER